MTAPRTPRTLIMGILNITPDSFSDGGQYDDAPAALAHARQLISEGADILDIGGESTRPGAEPVDPQTEQQRILPVLEQLLELDVRLSLDTRNPATARAALELAGSRAPELIINDVSGLLTDPQMPAVVAEFGCEVVITHNRGDSQTMQQRTDYQDLLGEVRQELKQIRQLYLDAGVQREKIILDPGIGFAKTPEQNWQLIAAQLGEFISSGHRVLLGVSRKGFLGALLADAQGTPRPAAGRDTVTAILSAHAASLGCWAVRVHNVQASDDAVRLASHLGSGYAWTPIPDPDGSAAVDYVDRGWG